MNKLPFPQTKSSVLPIYERKNKMKSQTHSDSNKKILVLVIVLVATLALSSCASRVRAEGPYCDVDMNMRVTIDVTDVKPQVVFDQLARNPDCAITVSPFVRKHVTLRVENATVSEVLASVCSQIGCKYILNGSHLAIKPYTFIDRLKTKQGEQFNMEMEVQNTILQSHLPGGMSFEAVPLSLVLEEISKASGLDIKPWKDEGDRKVTLDISGMTVDEALKAVVLNVDGEGAVLIKLTYRFPPAYGQHWPWGYPPTR
jgi:type II secretory pathway component GspD/PulD (secretin)